MEDTRAENGKLTTHQFVQCYVVYVPARMAIELGDLNFIDASAQVLVISPSSYRTAIITTPFFIRNSFV